MGNHDREPKQRDKQADKFENFNYLNVAFISYKLTMWN